MKILSHLLFSLFITTLLGYCASVLPFGSFIPSASLPLIIYFALNHSLRSSLVVASILGYIIDRLSLAPTGLHIAIFVWCAFICYIIASQLSLNDRFSASIIAFIAQGFTSITAWLLIYSHAGNAAFPGFFHLIQLPGMFICAFLLIILWPAHQRIDTKLTKEQTQYIRNM